MGAEGLEKQEGRYLSKVRKLGDQNIDLSKDEHLADMKIKGKDAWKENDNEQEKGMVRGMWHRPSASRYEIVFLIPPRYKANSQ